jgi:RNA polymerase sigma factor (TIGR02999 family)
MQPSGPDASISALIAAADARGGAAQKALFEALYAELHRLAESHVHRAGRHVSLGTTTLLHEAYLEISKRDALAFPDRRHFFAYASRAMRGLVIDYVRQRFAQKRGGELTFTVFDESVAVPAAGRSEVERIGAGLDELERLDPALAQLVDLKFFCGLTFAEIAAMRGVSERTIQRDWAKARVLLREELEDV